MARRVVHIEEILIEFLPDYLKGRDLFQDVDEDGRIILD
jgi:hypothetical protein